MAAELLQTAESYVYNLTIGFIVLLVGLGLGVLLKKVVLKILQEIELNKVLGKVGLTYDLERWISSIVSFVVYLITLVIFLNQLGITSIVLYLIVGAILMLIVLTFIVGLKDVFPNLVAWIVIQRRGHIKEGSRVEVKEISGVVEKVGMMETEIRTENGDILYVPNSLFVKSKFWVRN